MLIDNHQIDPIHNSIVVVYQTREASQNNSIYNLTKNNSSTPFTTIYHILACFINIVRGCSVKIKNYVRKIDAFGKNRQLVR